MSLQQSIQPITYLKAHAAELAEKLAETGEPMIVTQNGRATLVVQDIRSYEATQQTLAMMQLVAMGQNEIAEGRGIPAKKFFREIRQWMKKQAALRGNK